MNLKVPLFIGLLVLLQLCICSDADPRKKSGDDTDRNKKRSSERMSESTGNCSKMEDYLDCKNPGSQGRVDFNCKTMHFEKSHNNAKCIPGCYCLDGMVRGSSGNCIPADECSCSSENNEYPSGSVVTSGCKKCTCQKGKWDCKSEVCPRVCFMIGTGQMKQFNGKSLMFDSNCPLTLAKGEVDGKHFEITTQSEYCCDGRIPCSRNILIKTNTTMINVTEAGVNYSYYSSSSPDVRDQCAAQVGQKTVVKAAPGVYVSHEEADVSIKVMPSFNGTLEGLCGDNKKDDYSGMRVSNSAQLGDSWNNDPSCRNTMAQKFPCDENPGCRSWAENKCSILMTDAFKECNSKVDPAMYYKMCEQEACMCNMEGRYSGLCSSISKYAEACLEVGVCVTWRKPDLCPMICDYYDKKNQGFWHYEPCGSQNVKTCNNQKCFAKFAPLSEGCYPRCPANKPYLDHNTLECVQLSDCSCIFMGKPMEANSVTNDQFGKECTCTEGKVTCKDTFIVV
ncbi:mucin-19-like [Gastrophryne carolinensis]